MYKIMGNANFGSEGYVNNVEFYDFGSSKCGAESHAIGLNPSGSDYVPPVHFKGVHFEDVRQEGFTYIFDPPSGWANIADCGEWPCTAPENVLMKFE